MPRVNDTWDHIVIGAGLNGLVAAAYLARAGRSVLILEAEDRIGGASYTTELTLPGYHHDPMAAWHPMFLRSPVWQDFRGELTSRGVEFRTAPIPTGSVTSSGDAYLAYPDADRTVAQFSPADAEEYRQAIAGFTRVAGVMGRAMSAPPTLASLARAGLGAVRRLGVSGSIDWAIDILRSPRAWLDARFEGRGPGAIIAPWALHAGLGADNAGGGLVLPPMMAGWHNGGMPVPVGGAGVVTGAFAEIVRAHGGEIHTGRPVDRILVEHGRATGVQVKGAILRASRSMISSASPWELFDRLLADVDLPASVRKGRARLRPGARAGMQMHFALSEPLRWNTPDLDSTAVVHISDGAASVARACAEAAAGLLPAMPTLVVGQPAIADPSRVPDGAGILWVQLLEVPARPVGDAAGHIAVDDGWTEAVVAEFATRVRGLIAQHATNFETSLRAQAVMSPRDLEQADRNLVAGDPYSGSVELDQSMFWRPFRAAAGTVPGIARLQLCGAGVFPGPGLSGISGRIAAMRALGVRGRVARPIR